MGSGPEILEGWENVEAEIYQSKPLELEVCPVCQCRISGLILHEDDSWRCPICHSRFLENVVIEIEAVDNGDYPFEVGSAMVGMYFMAMRSIFPIWDEYGRWCKSEQAYAVEMRRFLMTLEMMSPVAHRWYETHGSGLADCMFFRKREVEELTVVLEVEPDTFVDNAMIWEIIQNQDECLEGTDFGAAYKNF